MTPLGLTLVLAAALCHATWNFFVKRINGGPELVWLFSALSTVLYLPLAIAIVVLQEVTFDLEQSLFIAGSVALHLAYVLLLQAGYRNGDLSLVYPMARATGPLLSTTFAVFFLGETVTAQMGLGAGVIICGVLFLTGGLRPRAANISVSLSFGLGVGLLIGGYTVWDAHAVATLLVPPLLLDYAASVGRAVLLAPIALRRRAAFIGHWREHRTGVLAIAVLSPLAYILVLHAPTFTPVAYVAPLREVSVLLTVLAASLLLGEGRLRRRLIWSAVIVGGVVLLAQG